MDEYFQQNDIIPGPSEAGCDNSIMGGIDNNNSDVDKNKILENAVVVGFSERNHLVKLVLEHCFGFTCL